MRGDGGAREGGGEVSAWKVGGGEVEQGEAKDKRGCEEERGKTPKSHIL